ncbi:hypothetical protein N0B44_21930 [Roseibacterium beibuensis]|uniref:hypothetical protein n=1 Tax=[Roseibacterium] beibuensis TaxID=1193142 RepID=UPI00217D5DBF|nr:hypothetical protein [Roseibacterium beibuensis]MCS6625576.1 hypothetical protein [Roseibacterium beibuensis]
MRKIAICALAAMSLAACATVEPVPNARPLNAARIEALGPTPVVVAENNTGVMKSWFRQDSSAAAASQGLLGALVGAAIDGIMNYAPSRRARSAANELAEVMPAEALTESLVQHFSRQIATGTPGDGVVVSGVQTVQKVVEPGTVDDAIEVTSSYLLSEDATTLQVSTTVTYHNAAIPYVTPYTFENAPPKTELTGPLYRNSFTYSSRQLPVPVLTPELRERLIASIRDNARDESGALPVEGTDAFKSMNRELEEARDDKLTKAEIAIFLAREWTRDNGALLRAEIDNAHAFVARYALLDMNRTAIPSLTGVDELVETLPDGRTVRRGGPGISAGSYVSLPGDVSDFVTYGNAAAIAEVNETRLRNIQEQARAARRAQ